MSTAHFSIAPGPVPNLGPPEFYSGQATTEQVFSSVPEGAQTAAVGSGSGVDTLSQELSANLLANTLYTLGYYVGQLLDVSFVSYSADVNANGVGLLVADSLGAAAANTS